MTRILAVDCDLTVCPSDKGWRDWLEFKNFELFLNNYEEPNTKYPWDYQVQFGKGKLPYNLGKMFPSVEDPLAYWRELDYNQFQPLEGAVEKLKALSTYFNIVFISAIKGNHTKTKYYWLKQHFPFMSAYVATKEKWVLNQDETVALIDDRLDNLEGFDYNKRVLFKTPYEQSSDCSVAYTIEDWNSFSVKDFCKEYLV